MRPPTGSTRGAGGEVTLVGRFLPSEAPMVPDEDADPFSMQTVAVAQLINVWADYDDRPVYFGYVTATEPAAGLEAIVSPPPEESVGAQLAQRLLRGGVGRVRGLRDLPLVPARARRRRARARRGREAADSDADERDAEAEAAASGASPEAAATPGIERRRLRGIRRLATD